METGNIVEYIDRQRIICAVVLDVKDQKLRLLNENNREIKMTTGRLSHKSSVRLDISQGRDQLAAALKECASRRQSLVPSVNVQELWEVLNSEQEWIDLETMTELCFSTEQTADHESAVVRAFFDDRSYFKFNMESFFPYTAEQVDQFRAQAAEEARKQQIIDDGAQWVSAVLRQLEDQSDDAAVAPLSDAEREYAEILREFYLFEKESKTHDTARSMMGKAGIRDVEKLFNILAAVGVWTMDENVDLYRFDIAIDFSEDALQQAAEILETGLTAAQIEPVRRDLTARPALTIDGESTLDYDDALSIEITDGLYVIDVHISDVAQVVTRDSAFEKAAKNRGTSIYMPDQKISMLPPSLAEGCCSLKAGQVRPTVTTRIRMTESGGIVDYEVFPSLIKVTDQLIYNDVNEMIPDHPHLSGLYRAAKNFRNYRMESGATQISLPEINLWFDKDKQLSVSRIARESDSRLLVSELMILANWHMARFLSEKGLPAVFRSQPAPKERLYKGDQGSLFQNWMQRKLLNRFILSPTPEPHAGLGLDSYLTATSPIRKYFDLITQRQIRSAFGLEPAYTPEEIEKIIQVMEAPMANAGKLQFRRKRYWLFKYLESQIGEETQAIVLMKRRNGYQVLLVEYMLEISLSVSSGIELKPEDMVCVKIQHVDARKDVLSIFMV